MRLFGVVL